MGDLNLFVKENYDFLHKIPEVGLKEVKTSAYLAEQLKTFGYDVRTGIGETGVVGILTGKEAGPVIVLRADMDALLHLINGEEIAIHSCGHDAHCAMVLAVAKEIADKGLKKGKIKIMFQPAEEILAGALAMIDAGIIDDADIAIGIHLRSSSEAKKGEATPALYHGASVKMTAAIEGLSAHGARPHLGINAIDAGCLAVQAVNAIHLDPIVPTTVKVTRFTGGGGATNIIPDRAELVFDLRSQKNTGMEELIEKTARAIETAAASIGAKATVKSNKGVPAAELSDDLIDVAREAIISVLGKEGLLEPTITPGGEDFHFFVKHKPSLKALYIGLGADLSPGLHHPEMTINKEALIDGVKILLNIIERL
ncbi:MAG: amidohydrolase [Treponema sp.]|nr:amidohydrolase [Treponema sp.]